MSRGLGVMQRSILDTLDEARAAAPRYRGSGEWCDWGLPGEGDPETYDPAGWVWYRKQAVRLAEGVYDLRCSAVYLKAQRELERCGSGSRSAWRSERFLPAFTRAVRSLLRRRLLRQLTLVPLLARDRFKPTPDVHHLADGLYLDARDRQIRFVTRG